MFKRLLLLSSGIFSLSAFSLPLTAPEIDIYLTGTYHLWVKNGQIAENEKKPYNKLAFKLINRGNYYLGKGETGNAFKLNSDCSLLEDSKITGYLIEKGSFFLFCPEKPSGDSFRIKLKNYKEAVFKKTTMKYDYDGDGVVNETAYVYTVFNPSEDRWESLYMVYNNEGKLKYMLYYLSRDNSNYKYGVLKFAVKEKSLQPPPPPRPAPPPIPKPAPPPPTPQPKPKPPQPKGGAANNTSTQSLNVPVQNKEVK